MEEGVSETLYALGTACVPGAFDKARLAELRDSFLEALLCQGVLEEKRCRL